MVACWLFPFLYQTLLRCHFLYPLQSGGIGWLAVVAGVGQFVDVLVGCWLRTLRNAAEPLGPSVTVDQCERR
jgi:hypothetical protein